MGGGTGGVDLQQSTNLEFTPFPPPREGLKITSSQVNPKTSGSRRDSPVPIFIYFLFSRET